MKKFLEHLSVVILSAGEESLEDCLKALNDQDCSFRIEEIKDICPMSTAFQMMHQICKTSYFIQLDADVILKPYAVSFLYERIKRSNFLCYNVSGQLYEEGFGPGGSVRCWKKYIFRIFRFRDIRTVDRDFYKRARLLGFHRKSFNEILGTHRPRHSHFSEYLKTKSDVEKWRYLKRHPDKYATGLFDSLMEEKNSCKLLGFLLGTLTSKKRLSSSKNVCIEKKRFFDIKDALGYHNNEEFSMEIKYIKDFTNLEKLFKTNYLDLNNSNRYKRKELLNLIVKVFSKNNKHIDIRSFDSIVKY